MGLLVPDTDLTVPTPFLFLTGLANQHPETDGRKISSLWVFGVRQPQFRS